MKLYKIKSKDYAKLDTFQSPRGELGHETSNQYEFSIMDEEKFQSPRGELGHETTAVLGNLDSGQHQRFNPLAGNWVMKQKLQTFLMQCFLQFQSPRGELGHETHLMTKKLQGTATRFNPLAGNWVMKRPPNATPRSARAVFQSPRGELGHETHSNDKKT